MKLPQALLKDPAYRKALKLSNSISKYRFALAALAYELREENYIVWYRKELDNGFKVSKAIYWSGIIAAAEGIAVKTAQERAQVGEFCAKHNPQTTRYSRVSSAVRYCGVIDDAELVQLIEDENEYPTVQDLQSVLWQVAHGVKEFTPKIITRSLSRMASAGAALLSLNGRLPADIRDDVTTGTAAIGRALQVMKARTK